MRVGIYARYSTDMQDPTSIVGQVTNCKAIALANGWSVVKVYCDEAISGSDDSRPGYLNLLADSEAGKFDAIIVDETSRLTRRPGELPRILEHLAFRNQFLLDCKGFDSRQETATLLASIYGGIDSLELRKIKDRTHRGLRERAKGGFSTGGKTYGYRTEPVDPKDPESKKRLVIVEDEAEVVREIFTRYADFESPRAIADDLNRRKVPSPGSNWKRTKRRAKGWTGSAICGTAAQFTGILRRELYIGQQIWNRRRSKKVPGTSKRIFEIRPKAEWEIVELPELRVIDDLLWNKVQARLKESREKAHPNNLAPRGRPSRYLLSGILTCDECGGNFVMHDSRAYGCASHTNGGKHLCGNKLRVRRDLAEPLILGKIREQLLDVDVVASVTEQFEMAIKTVQAGGAIDPNQVRSELKTIEAKIEKILGAVEEIGISESLAERLRELEQEKDRAQRRLQLAKIDAAPIAALPDLVPALVKRWRQLVDQIGSLATNRNASLADVETARGHLSALLGKVRLKPKDGVLWAYPALNAKGLAEASPLHIKVVAGAGFEPATFGL